MIVSWYRKKHYACFNLYCKVIDVIENIYAGYILVEDCFSGKKDLKQKLSVFCYTDDCARVQFQSAVEL